MGRHKKHNTPRKYISSREEQVKRFRETYPEGPGDFERIEEAIKLKKQLDLKKS